MDAENAWVGRAGKCSWCGATTVIPSAGSPGVSMFLDPVVQPKKRKAGRGRPAWLTPSRIWTIFSLGSAAIVMLALTAVFTLQIDIKTAVSPFLGFGLCASALVLFFRHWSHE